MSIASDTTTLCDPKEPKGKQASSQPKSENELSDSAKQFAKKAKQQGWAAPTATKPSFSG